MNTFWVGAIGATANPPKSDAKYAQKSVQLVRCSSFQSDFLQNPYFSSPGLIVCNIVVFRNGFIFCKTCPHPEKSIILISRNHKIHNIYSNFGIQIKNFESKTHQITEWLLTLENPMQTYSVCQCVIIFLKNLVKLQSGHAEKFFANLCVIFARIPFRDLTGFKSLLMLLKL